MYYYKYNHITAPISLPEFLADIHIYIHIWIYIRAMCFLIADILYVRLDHTHRRTASVATLCPTFSDGDLHRVELPLGVVGVSCYALFSYQLCRRQISVHASDASIVPPNCSACWPDRCLCTSVMLWCFFPFFSLFQLTVCCIGWNRMWERWRWSVPSWTAKGGTGSLKSHSVGSWFPLRLDNAVSHKRTLHGFPAVLFPFYSSCLFSMKRRHIAKIKCFHCKWVKLVVFSLLAHQEVDSARACP